MNRRQFLSALAISVSSVSMMTLTGCQSFQPKPFNTGRTITAPQGCSQLLERDERGDC
jgi:hypothetical protein